MDLPIICATSEEFGANIKVFQEKLAPGKGVVSTGVKTMGGITDAPARFANGAARAYVGLADSAAPDAITVATKGVAMLREIVEQHVFHDANGRSAMYALYLLMACWGYKLSLPPIALHAYLYGENQRDRLPIDAVERLTPFAKPLSTEGEGRSHLSHIQRKLSSLEKTREYARMLVLPSGREVSPKNGPAKLVGAGEKALQHVDAVRAYGPKQMDKRANSISRINKINALKKDLKVKFCSSNNNPWVDEGVEHLMQMLNEKIKRFEKENERLPNVKEIQLR